MSEKTPQQQFLDRILNAIKEYERIECIEIGSIEFDFEQATFAINLKTQETKLN